MKRHKTTRVLARVGSFLMAIIIASTAFFFTPDTVQAETLEDLRTTDIYKAVTALNPSADFTNPNKPGNTYYDDDETSWDGFADCPTGCGCTKAVTPNGLCCASFVNYYLWNYLPNVAGKNSGVTWKSQPNRLEYNVHIQRIGAGSPWYSLAQASLDTANTGWSISYDGNPNDKMGLDYSFVADDYAAGKIHYHVGDILVFSDSNYRYAHVAVYAGYYNGQHWLAHCTASHGGGVMLTPFDGYSIVKTTGTIYTSKVFTPNEKGAIEVYKRDLESGNGLAGAEFVVKNSEGQTVTTIGPTNSNGYAITQGGTNNPFLPFGTYTVTETVFPSGYEATGATSWTVTLSKNSPIQSNVHLETLRITNKKSLGSMGVYKTDEEGNALSGVTFGIYSDSGCTAKVGEITTGADGYGTQGGYAPAIYYLKEISTKNESYLLDTTVYPVTVTANEITYINGGSAVVNQRKYWQLTVTKQDSTTGTAQGNATLSGAVYGLYNSSGALLKQYTTNANGQFITDRYLAGTGYYLQEISPSTGYLLDSTRHNLDTYTNPIALTSALTSHSLTVPEMVISGQVQIQKSTLNVFTGTRTPENGAKFQYYLKSAGSYSVSPVKGEITTNSSGVATTPSLPYGTYVIHQTAGAPGTDMIADFEVVVNQNDKTYTYTKDNALWMATLQIEKVEKDTTIPLVAEFTLWDGDTAVETKSTDSTGKLTFATKLVYGKSYYVTESEVEGFDSNTTRWNFSCTQRNQVITHKIENTPTEGSITARKSEVSGAAMSNVTLLLEFSMDEGKTWNPIQKRGEGDLVTAGYCDNPDLTADGTLTTDQNGFVCFTGLRIDSQVNKPMYRLTEVKTEDDKTLLTEPAWTGHLPADIDDQPVINLEVTVTNGSIFELPKVGGDGFWFVSIGAILLIGAISTTTVFWVRKRKKEYPSK